MAWAPSDPAQFTADYLKMSNDELTRRYGGTKDQTEKYIRAKQIEGALPGRLQMKKALKSSATLPTGPISEPTGEMDERETQEDGTVRINMRTRTTVKTLEDLIRVCEIDIESFEIINAKFKKWDMGIKAQHTAEDGTITFSLETESLYAVSATLKPRTVIRNLREEITLMVNEIRACAPKKWPIYNHPADLTKKYMLELSITDAHFGKLAWWQESGESYDLKIAEAVFVAAVEDLLSKSSGYHFEEILFVVGNDLFNADNRNNTTFAGTPQTTDVRYQKTFTTVRRVIQDVVERLLRPRAKKVRVMMVSGNHDTETVFMFGEVLDAYFHNCADVVIDNQPTQRKYAEFGQCMLMFTHGSEEKHNDLPIIMAQEDREMWGRTRYREIHLGHFHKRKQVNWIGLDEHKGVSVRILPSLCAAEDWHTSKGYIGNIRSAEAYVWEADSGLCAMFYHTVPPFSKPK